MCAPFSTFRAFVSSFECTSLRFHSTAAAKVGGMKTSIKKRRTRKKKDHPEDIFVLLEVFLSLEYICVTCLFARVEKIQRREYEFVEVKCVSV